MTQPYEESMRFDHPITPDDWVLEIGAHKGFDSRLYASKYGCTVVAYEPVKEFFDELDKLDPELRVIKMQYAVVGLHNITPNPRDYDSPFRNLTLGIRGELSGAACGSDQREDVLSVQIADVITSWSNRFDRFPALLSMNIEGGEWSVLPALIAGGQHKHIPRIQYQPHSVLEGCTEGRHTVRVALAKTHEPIWPLPESWDVVWEGWKLRT